MEVMGLGSCGRRRIIAERRSGPEFQPP